jgi:hypothetical protein
MYFDSLTVVSLVIFAIAFGSFVYACVIRGCMPRDARNNSKQRTDSRHDDS